MILTSKGHFPKHKPTGSDVKYCLMVNKQLKVTMVFNFNAREYMDIRDKEGKSVSGLYTEDEIKKMYKTNEIEFCFVGENQDIDDERYYF